MTFVTKGQVDCLRRAFRSSRLLWLPGTKIGRCFGDTLTSNRRRSTPGAVPRRHERLKTSPFATERSLQGVGGYRRCHPIANHRRRQSERGTGRPRHPGQQCRPSAVARVHSRCLEDFDATMKTNIYAPFWIVKAALPPAPRSSARLPSRHTIPPPNYMTMRKPRLRP